MTPDDDSVHRCFICGEPFAAGQMVLQDVTEGLAHRACYGNDRAAFVKDVSTGAPLRPDDPLPTGFPYDPGEGEGLEAEEVDKIGPGRVLHEDLVLIRWEDRP